MPEAARVYAEALFEAGKDKGKLDSLQEQLGQFADAVDGNRELQVFLFSPYLSSADKQRGAAAGDLRRRAGADELPRAADRESTGCRKSSASGASSTSSGRRRTAASTSPSSAPSSSTEAVVEKIGEEVERQTGEEVELSSRVDDGILGGIVLQVGNMVLDASIRSRLEKLRKTVATAA